MNSNINNCVTANSIRTTLMINGENFSFDIKKTNGEHKLLNILPALFDYTDTIRRCELRGWHVAIMDLFTCFCEGGFILQEDYDYIKNIAEKLKHDKYVLFTIITNFRLNNYDFGIDPNISDSRQLLIAQRKLSTIKHQLFVACLSNIVAYDKDNNHIQLNTLDNITHIFKDDEQKIYELCFKSLQIQFQQFLIDLLRRVQVKPPEKKKENELNQSQPQTSQNTEITDTSAT